MRGERGTWGRLRNGVETIPIYGYGHETAIMHAAGTLHNSSEGKHHAHGHLGMQLCPNTLVLMHDKMMISTCTRTFTHRKNLYAHTHTCMLFSYGATDLRVPRKLHGKEGMGSLLHHGNRRPCSKMFYSKADSFSIGLQITCIGESKKLPDDLQQA